MATQKSATHGVFAHLLPPEEPCFVYAQREQEGDMPDVTEEIAGLVREEVLAEAFPEEFEFRAVKILLGACSLEPDGGDAGGWSWKACNWGLMDRFLGRWYLDTALLRRWVALKRLLGLGYATAAERRMRTHLWVFSLETALIRVRAALEQLERAGIVRRYLRYVDDYGAMAFYEFTPLFVQWLRAANRAVEEGMTS